MNLRTFARRSLRHYFRAHLGVLAGATLAAAVLIGALAVGDSVKGSLARRALTRLERAYFAVQTGDRFFTREIGARFWEAYNWGSQPAVPKWQIKTNEDWLWGGIQLRATAARQDGTARANNVQMLAFGDNYFEKLPNEHRALTLDGVWVNHALAQHLNLKEGDELIVRAPKPSAISKDAILSPKDDAAIAFRLPVKMIMPPGIGELSLDVSQQSAMNLYVPRSLVEDKLGLKGRANLMLVGGAWANEELRQTPAWLTEKLNGLWQMSDTNSVIKPIAGFSQTVAGFFFGRRTFPVPDAEVTTAFREALNDAWSIQDAELSVRAVETTTPSEPFTELTTRRIFLEPAVVKAALAKSTKVRPVKANSGPSEEEILGKVPTVPGGQGDLAPRPITLPAVAVPALLAEPNLPDPTPVLTYLVNSLAHGDNLTPYSMVTAAGAPYTPADLKDDEIVVNQWLAEDLGVKPGDTVKMAYYRVDSGTLLAEHTNTFRVHSVVPLAGLHADRTLMPEFPGLAKAESTRDWDAGFDLVHTIRDQDEAYWKQHRGAPKAFITLAAGQKMWANRFGDLTAIRWFASRTNDAAGQQAGKPAGESENLRPAGPLAISPASPAELRDAITARIRANLNPADVGLVWRPVREEALKAATSGQDFGGLFIGFSFFLIVAALLLTAMLFSFSLDQRATEAGILLALGWEPKRVRRVLFREGFTLAALGTLLGAVVGVYYAKGVLWGLTTIWRDAVAGAGLEFHLTATTLLTGIGLSLAVAAGTMFLALRKQAKRPARELLNEGANESALNVAEGDSRRAKWIALGLGLAGTGLAAAAGVSGKPELFFGAGALLLIGGLLWVRAWIRSLTLVTAARSFGQLALRALARRPSRSLGTVALLASAAFLIIAVGANKLDATKDATKRSSGTGGFALWGESSLPVIQDLNTRKGRDFYGLDEDAVRGTAYVQFRVRDGDDASCLNLNRAQRPRLLGVKPEQLAERGAFTFTKLEKGLNVTNGWLALSPSRSSRGNEAPSTGSTPDQSLLTSAATEVREIPAIGDANSIQWALGKKLGDTLDYVDERGQPFKVRLVGAVANSVLQGNLIIAESEFVRLFPSESGYRAFLIDVAAEVTKRSSTTNPPPHVGGYEAVSAALSRALQDVGLELTPTARRLAQFNAVQNTYLNTFQILGGLGLLLGSVGLGVVVLRNVHERRGELGLMLALGFEGGALKRLVLTEHTALLLLGLAVGVLAALVAVLPALLSPGSEVPWGSLAITLGLVLANGLIWTVWATARSLRGKLVDALRDL